MFVLCRTLADRFGEEPGDGCRDAIITGVSGASTEAEAADGVLGAVFLIEYNVQKNIGLRLERFGEGNRCLLYTSPSPRDYAASRMPSSA